MPFCPECLSEFKAGITYCSDCNRDLVAQLTSENMVHDTSDVPMLLLRTFASSTEAEMVQEVLIQNGIRVLLQGEAASSTLFPTTATAVNLLVDERDVERARELMAAYFEAELVEGDNTETTDN